MALVAAAVGGFAAWRAQQTLNTREQLALQPDPAYFNPEPTTLPPRPLEPISDADVTCPKKMRKVVLPPYESVKKTLADGRRFEQHLDRTTGNYEAIIADEANSIPGSGFIRRVDSLSYLRRVNGSWQLVDQPSIAELGDNGGHPIPQNAKPRLVGPETLNGHQVCRYSYEGGDAGSPVTLDLYQNGAGIIEWSISLRVSPSGKSTSLETITQPMAPFEVEKPV